MSQIVVNCGFTISWDADECRRLWNEPDLSDEEILQDCLLSVEQDWNQYATEPESISVDGTIID